MELGKEGLGFVMKYIYYTLHFKVRLRTKTTEFFYILK
jgi:hypothetical protein